MYDNKDWKYMSIKLEIGQTDQLLLSFKYDEEIIKIDMLQNELKLKEYSTKTLKSCLGHSSSKTTEIYTHVTRKSIQNISSLLDMIVRKDNQV